MGSAEPKPIMGLWGFALSGVQGYSPRSRGKAPKAESILFLLSNVQRRGRFVHFLSCNLQTVHVS